MRNFFQKIGDGFRRFMAGRYGSDQLSRFTIMLAMLMLVLNIFFGSKTTVFYWLIWVFLLLSYFRMFSKNIEKRYNENTRFLQIREKVTRLFGKKRSGSSQGASYAKRDTYRSYEQAYNNARTGPSSNMRSDKDHRIFRCPNCDQRVRVPRGRGKIEITCPRCSHRFVKRS